MVSISNTKQSLLHSVAGGVGFGIISSAVTAQYYSQEINDILSSGIGQGIASLATSFVNLRTYDISKQTIYTKTDDIALSRWSAGAISGLITFLSTYIIQEISVGKGSIDMGIVYGLFTFVLLPTLYELHLKNNNSVA